MCSRTDCSCSAKAVQSLVSRRSLRGSKAQVPVSPTMWSSQIPHHVVKDKRLLSGWEADCTVSKGVVASTLLPCCNSITGTHVDGTMSSM